MEVQKTCEQGVTIFRVSGEISIATSPEFKKILGKDPVDRLVVDLENVSYINSSGLATLVDILKKTKTRGGALALTGLSAKVKSLFEVTKLDRLFFMASSVDEAIRHLNSSGS